MGTMDDVVKEFLVESSENLDQMNRDLVELEKNPTSRETLASVFRMIHTIKGAAGFLAFPKLEAVAHVGESLLSRVRGGVLTLNLEITSGLWALVDAIRQMLSSIEATGTEGDEDYTAVTDRLVKLQRGERAATQPSHDVAGSGRKPTAILTVEPPNSSEVDETLPIGEILTRDAQVKEHQVVAALDQQLQGDPRHIGEILVEKGVIQAATLVDALHEQQGFRSHTIPKEVPVDVSRMDKLMNLADDLVLVRNEILRLTATHRDANLLRASQRLDVLTTELQGSIMRARMQPIDNLWNKLPRLVRDLAQSCGKQVRIDMEGSDTELEKTIIQAIKDPLTHLIRNSVDHGIEAPAKRAAAGKSPEGRLLLRAFQENGQVNIEVTDDGAGVDADRVKRKAIALGLITPRQAAQMAENDALSLLFVPGFSTADQVTNVSGRGVGLDIVKTNVEKIGGTVDIQNRPGQGVTFKIKIPLTLARPEAAVPDEFSECTRIQSGGRE